MVNFEFSLYFITLCSFSPIYKHMFFNFDETDFGLENFEILNSIVATGGFCQRVGIFLSRAPWCSAQILLKVYIVFGKLKIFIIN